jgi:ATP-dependent exoDNAse (exonuclease V) alpha subunit
VTTLVTLRAGHDVAYFTRGTCAGGCVGAMSYYTAAGEPPGQWAGQGAASLGLRGEVDPAVIERLYQKGIGPDGEMLLRPRAAKPVQDCEDAAVAAYTAEHPFASAVEIAEVRAAERAKGAASRVPYYDMPLNEVKSVSVLHASLRVAAKQARDEGEDETADELDGEADGIETDLIESARLAVEQLEAEACYTRTGHHSATTGEWRDGKGLTAALYLHHISRDGDPQLHVHIPIANLVQRADGADDTWRSLDGQQLYQMRLSVAAAADREMESRLIRRGYAMIPRADGNGAEVGGVSKDVMDLFSSRNRAITPELAKLIDQYTRTKGHPPSKRTIWLLSQQAAQNTRRSKAQARRMVAGTTGSERPTEAERLAGWERQVAREETQALSQVHLAARAYAAAHPPTRGIDEEDKARAARIAVAEVQRQHAAWSIAQLRFEVGRALPVGATAAMVTEVADLAVNGFGGTEVIRVAPAPDIADVSELGVRKDGTSIYRRPNETRYATLAHLDLEETVMKHARSTIGQLVGQAQAQRALEGSTLSPEQRDTVIQLLTAGTLMTVLTAPAGAGKTRTMAEFARAWDGLVGGRVIGITTAENAAWVMAAEARKLGAPLEAYNSAAFLGKIEGSTELRYPVQISAGDVLVLDESSMHSTSDLALILAAARRADAHVVATGDLHQLGAVEAGGMFRALARELGAIELHEVLRFGAQWERAASLRLRQAHREVFATYDTHGRIRHGDHEAACTRAASEYLADFLAGKDTLLLAGTNAEAAELARLVQSKLAAAGKVGDPRIELADGNHAGTGDIVRARHNTDLRIDGQRLVNRDVLKVQAFAGRDVQVRRQLPEGGWSRPFLLGKDYFAEYGELAYAGNVHVAQGRTTDTAHLLLSESISRQSLYVGMTRGRDFNVAHIVTGPTSHGTQPLEQATPESVFTAALERDCEELAATEQVRQAQEWTSGTGHVLNLWSASVKNTISVAINQEFQTRLSEADYKRYILEPQGTMLRLALRRAHLRGENVPEIISDITAADLAGSRSVTAVLYARLQARDRNIARNPGTGAASSSPSWAARTPVAASELAKTTADALDQRITELGQRMLERPEPWLMQHLGMLSPDASPLLREEYARRAGIAAAYREAAGITDPSITISLSGHKGSPELETLRQDTIRALEIPDDEALIRAASPGELEAQVRRGEQAQAAAPEPAHELRAVSLAEAEARVRAADPDMDEPAKAEAASLAVILGSQRTELEAAQADYERWAADTAEDRESAGQAKAELERRHAHEIDQPEAIGAPEPEIPEIEPEPEPHASPEVDMYEPEAADA